MSSNIEDKPRIYKGLAGVVVDTTAISKVVPETNSLTYRGYAVQDLAFGKYRRVKIGRAGDVR